MENIFLGHRKIQWNKNRIGKILPYSWSKSYTHLGWGYILSTGFIKNKPTCLWIPPTLHIYTWFYVSDLTFWSYVVIQESMDPKDIVLTTTEIYLLLVSCFLVMGKSSATLLPLTQAKSDAVNFNVCISRIPGALPSQVVKNGNKHGVRHMVGEELMEFVE